MERLSRKTLGELAEEQLQMAIVRGELSGDLPGYRELCRVFGISRSALEPAIAALVARGVLVSRGARRRLRVAEDALTVAIGAGAARKVLFLEPTVDGRQSSRARVIVWALRNRLTSGAWILSEHYAAIDQSRRSGRRLQTIIKAERPDFTLLMTGHQRTIEWFVKSGVPFGCLGGDAGEMEVPLVAYDSREMLRSTVRHFIGEGRRDLFVPLRVRTPGFVANTHEAIRQELAAAELVFNPDWHAPVLRENNAEALREAADRRFRHRIPDAWICYGHDMLFAAMGQLGFHGVRVPGRTALALLGSKDDQPWLPPWVGAFDLPIGPMISHILNWLHQGGRDLAPGLHKIPAVWRPGAPVG
jgi:hypothetical protein